MSGIKGMECIAKVKHPKLFYKIRRLTSGNRTGDAFGITVPSIIFEQFSGVTFHIVLTGSGFSFVPSGTQLLTCQTQ